MQLLAHVIRHCPPALCIGHQCIRGQHALVPRQPHKPRHQRVAVGAAGIAAAIRSHGHDVRGFSQHGKVQRQIIGGRRSALTQAGHRLAQVGARRFGKRRQLPGQPRPRAGLGRVADTHQIPRVALDHILQRGRLRIGVARGGESCVRSGAVRRAFVDDVRHPARGHRIGILLPAAGQRPRHHQNHRCASHPHRLLPFVADTWFVNRIGRAV